MSAPARHLSPVMPVRPSPSVPATTGGLDNVHGFNPSLEPVPVACWSNDVSSKAKGSTLNSAVSREQAIDSIAERLKPDHSIRALYLSGSFGAGLEDRFSDIDFLAVVDDDRLQTLPQTWRSAVSEICEIVLWREFKRRNLLINIVTAEWLRIDLVTVSPDQMGRYAQDGLKILFDRDRLFDGLPPDSAPSAPQPEKLKNQIEEFIRILGLMPVAMGRKEYFNSITGTFHLRNLLVDLLIEETGAPHRGGALHIQRLITDEQKALLYSLPALSADRESAIEANLAYAAAYLPRARKLAERVGLEWPQRFEQVTRENLKRELDVELP